MTGVFLDYAARGRNAWWRYVAGFILAVALSMLIGVALLIPLQLAGVAGDLSGSLMDATNPVPFYVSNGAIFLLLAVGFVLAARWLHGKRFGDLIGAWSWGQYGIGFAAWTGFVILVALVDFAIAPEGFRFTGSSRVLAIAPVALAGLAIQTFAEELVFRGYLTQGLMLAIRRPLATAVVSGLLFGAMHIPNGWPHAASATINGVAMAFVTIRTGSLALASGMHLANNLAAAVLVVSAGDAFKGSPGLLVQDTPHLMWWDTAMAAVGAVTLAVLVHLWMARREPRPEAS